MPESSISCCTRKRRRRNASASETVMQDLHAFTVRSDHPRVRAMPDIGLFADLAHVNFSQRGDSESHVDETLARMGYRRRVAVTTQHMGTVAHLVRTTDLVATVPGRLARKMVDEGGITAYPPSLRDRLRADRALLEPPLRTGRRKHAGCVTRSSGSVSRYRRPPCLSSRASRTKSSPPSRAYSITVIWLSSRVSASA